MSSTLVVRCACGKSYRVPALGVGKKITCIACGTRFRVEGPQGVEGVRPAPVRAAAPVRVAAAAQRTLPVAAVPRTERALDRPRPGSGRRRGVRRGSARVGAGSSGLLIAGVVAAILVGAGGVTLAITSPWSDSPLDYIPAGMDSVTRIQVRRGMEELGLEKDLDRAFDPGAAQRFGIDPKTDVDAIWIAVDTSGATEKGEGLLLLVEGRFDPQRILESEGVKEAKLEAKSHGGRSYYLVDASALPRPGLSGGFAWLGQGLIAVGSEADLRRAIDAGEGRTDSILEDDAMGELIENADEDALVWSALRLAPDTAAMLPGNAGGLRSLLVGAGHADGVLTLQATGGYETEAEAKEAAGTIERTLSAKGSQAPVPGLDGVILGQSMNVEGRRLELEIRIDTARAKKAIEEAFEAFAGADAGRVEMESIEFEEWKED